MDATGGDPNNAANPPPLATATAPAPDMSNDQDVTQMTCDVLCSLGAASNGPGMSPSESNSSLPPLKGTKSSSLAGCPKQHQLPMFLSKTYHMIDRCQPDIATWSADGTNFVVKNVEKFASSVLPLYFKHSNFSSFARQLNFYGFRKLRTDPILTSDVDPRTACYVRFYHEKFQKDRPELLHHIKRATKSDQQSKDELETLKSEVTRLKESMGHLRDDTDRRLAEMSYECNRRINNMAADYEKLAAVVHQLTGSQHLVAPAVASSLAAPVAAPAAPVAPPPPAAQTPSTLTGLTLHNNPHSAAIAAAAAVAAGMQPVGMPSAPAQATTQATTAPVASTLQQVTQVVAPVSAPPPGAADSEASGAPDLMQSLTHAATISLERQKAAAEAEAAVAAAMNNPANGTNNGSKRTAEGEAAGAPPTSVARS